MLASKTGGLIFRSCEGFLEDVAILNGVKCIHPEDRKRTPSKTIVDNCRKNTFNQIDNISPARIIISGAVALRSLLGESESRFSRGQIFDWNGISALHIGHFGRSATKDELKLTKAFITESRV